MATLTLTIPDDQVDRVRNGLARYKGVDPASFTAEDARMVMVDFLKKIVMNQEQEAAQEALKDSYAGPAVLDVT